MAYCTNCGAELQANANYCTRCGTPVKQVWQKPPHVPDPVSNNARAVAETLTITREKQLVCSAMRYDVTIDGKYIDQVNMGQTITTRVFSEVIHVEITSRSKMPKKRMWMDLQIGRMPKIQFKLAWPGDIHVNVSGAKVLQCGY